MFKRGCVVLLLILASACGGGSSPSSPSTPSLTGTWVGTGFFPGAATIQLTQSGTSLTGSWVSTQTLPPELGGGTSPGPSGTVSGSVNGPSVSMTFVVPVGATCPFPIIVTATVNGDQTTGTYATANSSCSGSFSFTGNGSWTKQ
jgi:hypothetical protein